jgi:hypothetical protein
MHPRDGARCVIASTSRLRGMNMRKTVVAEKLERGIECTAR